MCPEHGAESMRQGRVGKVEYHWCPKGLHYFKIAPRNTARELTSVN